MAPILTNPKPWYVGPGGSATAFTRHEAQKFARGILESQTYRDGLQARAQKGELAPAMEALLWYYAYGKPKEQIEVTVQHEDLSSLSHEELLARIDEKRDELLSAAAQKAAIPVEFQTEP